MNGDSFGELREWGRALEQLETRRKEGRLDEVQRGLARMIRYRDNWQVRERALAASRHIRVPEPELLSEILKVALDEDTYTDARILATQALGALIPRRPPVAIADGCDPQTVTDALKEQLSTPQAPVLRLTQEQAVEQITRGSVRVAS